MFFYEITRPFAYLTIKHPEKWKVDWLYPIILSICITCILLTIIYCSQTAIDFFSKEGLSSYLLSFIQTLPGFYIAALAAIAAFGGDNLDKLFPRVSPTTEVKELGVDNTIPLTRRRYLAMLFAYLTALSIVLTFITITSINASSFFYNLTKLECRIYFNLPFIFIYLVFIFQLVLVTFHSLYYLGDKIYDPSD